MLVDGMDASSTVASPSPPTHFPPVATGPKRGVGAGGAARRGKMSRLAATGYDQRKRRDGEDSGDLECLWKRQLFERSSSCSRNWRNIEVDSQSWVVGIINAAQTIERRLAECSNVGILGVTIDT